MTQSTGIWIDHRQAIIVNVADDRVSTKTLASGVGPHTHYAGSQEGGGEKKYEERHLQDLNRFYDEVIGQVGRTQALLLLGPGEAKLQLKERLAQHHAWPGTPVTVAAADKMTEPQIVARVKEHYGIPH